MRLDAIVRENQPWAGVWWRQRLVLGVAAASVRRAGRIEDEAALRDALRLSRPGGDPGPAGKFLLVWRELAARPASGDPRWPPPRRFSGFLTTKRCKTPSMPLRPALAALGLPPSPPRALLTWRGVL